MAQVEPIADPRERLRELFRRVSREMQSHVIYAALMQSLDHPLVKPVMARVSQRRIGRAHPRLPPGRLRPRARARTARGSPIPPTRDSCSSRCSSVLPRLSHEEFEAYVEHVIATLIPT